jgi:hypothetical protein
MGSGGSGRACKVYLGSTVQGVSQPKMKADGHGLAVQIRTLDLRCLHARQAKDAFLFRAGTGPCRRWV